MHEIDRISPRSTVLFSSPHGALRDVDPSSEHMYIMGYSFIKDIYLWKEGTWHSIQLIYGDEPQLIEEEKT